MPYKLLKDESDPELDHPPRPREGSKFVTVLHYDPKGSTLASSSPPPPPPTTEFQCGETPSEARSRSCIFDAMSLNWLPPACYDEDLTNDFLTAGNWTFSTDPRGEHRLAPSQVQAGDLEYVYTSQAFHVTHCVYMWRKMHRVLISGDPDRVDGFVADMEHTKHCGGILLKNPGQDAWGIPAVIKFPLCGRRAFNEQDGWFWVYNGEKVSGKDSEKAAGLWRGAIHIAS